MNYHHFIPQIPIQKSFPFLPSNIEAFFSNKQKIMQNKINITLPELFNSFERESFLFSISKQVHLSETIELILGIKVPDKIRRYRGFFLNLERAIIYFYIFHKIFLYFKKLQLAESAYLGYKVGRGIYESVWGIPFPWKIIRPARITKEVTLTDISNIKRINQYQQNIASKIARFIENDYHLVKTINEVVFLDEEEIELSGITGPILRSYGKIPKLKSLNSHTRRSSDLFVQFAYTLEGNFRNLLRISYSELILSLNRLKRLLEPFSPITMKDINISPNSEVTTSFSTTIGQSHLSVEIADEKILYFNYIPSEMNNMYGIMKILSSCDQNFQKLILLYLNPSIPLNS